MRVIERRGGQRLLLKAGEMARRIGDGVGERNLIATFSRFSRVSRARYTSPIPPEPRRATISYGPIWLPAGSGIRARGWHHGMTSPAAMLRLDEDEKTFGAWIGDRIATTFMSRSGIVTLSFKGRVAVIIGNWLEFYDFLVLRSSP